MNFIGDLARNIVLRSQQAQLKSQMSHLTRELASGQSANLREKLEGRTGQVQALEHDLAVSRQYLSIGTQTQGLLHHQQTALEQISKVVADSLHPVLALKDTATPNNLTAIASAARQGLEHVFSAMKQTHAGTPVFPGADRLGGVEELLTQLSDSLQNRPPDLSRAEALAQFFHAKDGPFQARFAGQDLHQQAILGSSDRLTLETSVVSEGVHQSVMDLADLTLRLHSGEDLEPAAKTLSQAQDALTITRADLGAREHRLDTLQVAQQARISALELARSSLTSADPFDTATRLEERRFQLEALFSVTARLSRLSLTEYL